MTDKYHIEFKLQQHTPLIHFQWDQEGATLRATEVKPKLDQFIIEKCLKENGVSFSYAQDARNKFKQKWKNWLVGKGNNEHVALDYKMSITSNSKKYVINKNPCFFGNISNEKEYRFVFDNSLIDVNIFSFNEGIIKYLNNNDFNVLVDFFCTQNFGTRQSKGFGSFTVEHPNESMKNDLVSGKITNYYFDVPIKENEKIEDQWSYLFKNISLFHRVIRSGYNQRQGYVKSSLYEYFNRKNIQWDKKTIKEHFLLNVEKTEGKERYLVRDLLGLATNSNWGKYHKYMKVLTSNEDIQRFKSPITYKPIQLKEKNLYRVFILLSDIPQEFLNKSFKIENKSDSFNLNTPSAFSLRDYFDFLIGADFSITSLISTRNKDTENIKQIFEGLKNNSKK